MINFLFKKTIALIIKKDQLSLLQDQINVFIIYFVI